MTKNFSLLNTCCMAESILADPDISRDKRRFYRYVYKMKDVCTLEEMKEIQAKEDMSRWTDEYKEKKRRFDCAFRKYIKLPQTIRKKEQVDFETNPITKDFIKRVDDLTDEERHTLLKSGDLTDEEHTVLQKRMNYFGSFYPSKNSPSGDRPPIENDDRSREYQHKSIKIKAKGKNKKNDMTDFIKRVNDMTDEERQALYFNGTLTDEERSVLKNRMFHFDFYYEK